MPGSVDSSVPVSGIRIGDNGLRYIVDSGSLRNNMAILKKRPLPCVSPALLRRSGYAEAQQHKVLVSIQVQVVGELVPTDCVGRRQQRPEIDITKLLRNLADSQPEGLVGLWPAHSE